MMVDVTFRQSGGERELVAVLQKIYICASVEFLRDVTDFFLQALAPPTSLAPSPGSTARERLPLKHTNEPQEKTGDTDTHLTLAHKDPLTDTLTTHTETHSLTHTHRHTPAQTGDVPLQLHPRRW